MRRRALLVAGLSLPLLGIGGRELLRSRRAEFVEAGELVLVTVALPELLSTRDADAVASLESAFATTLVFDVTLHRSGGRPVVSRRRVVKIQWDPWKERFAVAIRDDARPAETFFARERDAAIARAVTLQRLPIARTEDLERGPQATYFVTVIGQRNPITPDLLPDAEGEGVRGQGRDLAVFSRWIGIFVSDVPTAEKTVAIRTAPAFYLVKP